MNEPVVPPFLQEIADAFGAIDGVEAVVWCGSAALGGADVFSDFDLYVYTHAPVPVEVRDAVIAKRAIERQLNNTFWELEDEWIEPGGKRFNSMYRDCTYAVDEIEKRLDRNSASLGYTTAYCFSLANGFILYDARGWFNSVQARLREPFPERLARSIIAKNRPVLGGGMQSCYLVQMKAAIARNDLISLNHRTTVWIASYADILFAVNRRYHPGEKRLLTYMSDLPSRPEGALEDITKLCGFAGSLSAPIVEHVSLMLKRLDEWLNRAGPGIKEKTNPNSHGRA
jgi:predicted nucleotidyltransferase